MADRFALRARFVFPVDRPPIADGAVLVSGGRVEAVGQAALFGNAAVTPMIDLGNAALLPGLVNAHTHLELGGLTQPLGPSGIGMDQWVRRLLAFRRQPATLPPTAAVAAGLRESLAGGATLLGDIVQPGWPQNLYFGGQPASTPLSPRGRGAGGEGVPRTVAFLEIIAPTAARIPAARQAMARHVELARAANAASGTMSPVTFGLSPHAPHTVHADLLAEIVAVAAAHDLPLAFHLAESREELELLRQGTGPLQALMAELGAWDPHGFRPGRRPLDFLRILAAAPRTLVIHGNYLDDEEIAFLAEHRDRMTLVYCPRTHAHFGHPRYPLEKLLAAGVRMALGTDSRASSPDLSLLAEMRHVAWHYPDLSRRTILELGTRCGSAALAAEESAGVITPGRSADLVAVALPRGDGDAHDLLLGGDGAPVRTWLAGQHA